MANEISATLTRKLVLGGLTLGDTAQTITGNSALLVSETVPASTTNREIGLPLDISTIQVIMIVASAPCTIKTNSSGSPVETFTMLAGAPIVWAVQDGAAQQFLSVDLTKVFVTTTTDEALVRITALLDATP